MKLPAICLLLAALGLAFAQPPEPTFEAATIKPNHSADGGSYVKLPGATVTLTNMTLKRAILSSYQIRDFQLSGGPGWLDSDRFDIEAKAAPDASMDQKRVMLQNLFKERFRLALHRETKDLPTYNLVLAKGGLKIQALKEGACIKPDITKPGLAPGKTLQDYCGGMGTGPAMMQAGSATMPEIAVMLSSLVGRTVVDKTGVPGQFRFQMNFAPVTASAAQPADAADAATDGPSIFTALQDQLGLRLESSKGPVEVLVVDHAEKPSDN